MADFMSEHDKDVIIGLIPCAVSGTSLRDWFPGRKPWDQASKRIQKLKSRM